MPMVLDPKTGRYVWAAPSAVPTAPANPMLSPQMAASFDPKGGTGGVVVNPVNPNQPPVGALPPPEALKPPVRPPTPQPASPNFDQSAGQDYQAILDEVERQHQMANDTVDQTAGRRQQYLSDLSQMLQQQQAQQLTQALPGTYEDLNSRGLLRSSALGNELGRQQAALASQTSSTLGELGIAGGADDINAIRGNEQNYLTGRSNALSRKFSLQDYQRQIDASKYLGFGVQAPAGSGKGGGSILSGAASGAGTGALVGQGPGAVIGGTLGAITGGVSGGKH